ncbi:CaiB/BaiF CoA-transferase family protein [Sulfitobacter sp. S190]|uniref:CaiB/BaiF CoA transferase family protein n=1 Tax=Sulfitobacter sp. S190 TaxID=2867022 RepID=UPI0021A7BB40|nr:CaiB/BaiF CoA-transferase family protein [Sulfitobacter sp. S190]UWR21168.1 CoA transferase [Sulfitobacter sp. S190]
MGAPLDGIRVIDWTHVLAGPACAYMLAQLGAEVIKVERPGRGDAMRHRGGSDRDAAAAGMSTAYRTQGAGKQSIAIDLETREGHAVFSRLLERADVLVENHRPATLQRLGLSETHTRAINPRLIHCAMTGYGRGNAMSDAPAYDVNIQAISGLMALTGTRTTGPLRTGAPVIDYATALAGALGVLSALLARHTSGAGRFVDVSMLETAFTLMGSTIADYRLTGIAPQPRGNTANSRSPASGVFACAEGQISLGVNEQAQFEALCRALSRPELAADPRFTTAAARDENRGALADVLVHVLQSKSADHWEETLLAAGVPCARLRSLPEALELPAATHRAFATRGPGGFAGLPFGADGPASDHPPPPLGADTRAVLRALSYSDADIADLVARGAVGTT